MCVYFSAAGEVQGVLGVHEGGRASSVAVHLLPVRLSERSRHRSQLLAERMDERRTAEPNAGEGGDEGGGVRSAGHFTRYGHLQ